MPRGPHTVSLSVASPSAGGGEGRRRRVGHTSMVVGVAASPGGIAPKFGPVRSRHGDDNLRQRRAVLLLREIDRFTGPKGCL